MVARGLKEFEKKLTDVNQVTEWFKIDLVEDLKNSGQDLNDKQVYSYKKLPVLGGDYSPSNFEVTDHFCFAGEVHQQVRDLPDGTRIGSRAFL